MITDNDGKRIRERMHERSAMRTRSEFLIEVMWIYGKGKKADRCLCAVRGSLDGPAAEADA
jgi:hypothetical protein